MSDLTTLGALSARQVSGRITGRELVEAGATTAILKFTPPTNCTTTVLVTATARDLSNGDGAGYQRGATFKRTTGNVTQIGATSSLYTTESDISWDLTIAGSGSAVEVSAVGDGSNQTRWTFVAELTFAPDAVNGDSGGTALG